MEIDVSGCEHFYQYDQCKNTCHWFGTPCEWVDTKECTYKQLQQLKESNETLNKMLLILNDRLEEYKRIYGEL